MLSSKILIFSDDGVEGRKNIVLGTAIQHFWRWRPLCESSLNGVGISGKLDKASALIKVQIANGSMTPC